MMKYSQILIIAAISVAKTQGNARGRIPLTSPSKTYFPSSSKVAFGSFHTFGTSFVSPPPISLVTPSPPAIQRFSPTVGSFAEAGGSFATGGFSRTNDGFPQSGETFSDRQDNNFSPTNNNIPPTGEDFLRINQNTRPNPSGPPQTNTAIPPGDRTQGTGATGPFSFGIPTNRLEDLLEQEWSTFKTTFNKTYNSFEEERQRREIFIENRNKIARFMHLFTNFSFMNIIVHKRNGLNETRNVRYKSVIHSELLNNYINQEYGNGRHSFVQKLNQYADLLNHEFNGMVNGLNRTRTNNDQPAPERRPSAFIPAANVNVPSYVDWREAGAVTPVRRQGNCGACYAFAAAGALEGQNYRKNGRLVELSPQNLIDCTESYSNSGCVGGLMEYAFEYVRDNRGIATETAYPFEERDGQQCRYRQDEYGAHDTGYVLLDEGDERALEIAVATIGPVAIGIDAHPDSFQFYSNGVYFEPQCSTSSDQLNHAVLVVGYGTEPNGQQYWLIKNSYGPEWGIGGYMKLAKFSNNQCGVASYASYPLV